MISAAQQFSNPTSPDAPMQMNKSSRAAILHTHRGARREMDGRYGLARTTGKTFVARVLPKLAYSKANLPGDLEEFFHRSGDQGQALRRPHSVLKQPGVLLLPAQSGLSSLLQGTEQRDRFNPGNVQLERAVLIIGNHKTHGGDLRRIKRRFP